MSKPQAVFFDLDGTLIDTAPDMGGALNRMLENRLRPVVPAEVYRAHVSHGSIALLKLGFPELDPETELGELRIEFLATYNQDIARDSVLFDGMDSVLETLEAQNIPWGIITNKPEGLTLKLLDAMDLTRRCCSIVGADTTTHAKPHPAPMNLACERASVDPAKCLYIGDAERDIQAGRAVGMRTFIAEWGYIDPIIDNLRAWQADFQLQTPADLLNYIQ